MTEEIFDKAQALKSRINHLYEINWTINNAIGNKLVAQDECGNMINEVELDYSECEFISRNLIDNINAEIHRLEKEFDEL